MSTERKTYRMSDQQKYLSIFSDLVCSWQIMSDNHVSNIKKMER